MSDKRTEDLRNIAILETRMKQYNAIPGARVGDWIREPDGRMTRATHDWNDDGETCETIQHGGNENSSYYLGDGYLSYSGGLDSGIKKCWLRETAEKKDGCVWIFDHGFAGAGRGVGFVVEFRVFEVQTAYKQEYEKSVFNLSPEARQ